MINEFKTYLTSIKGCSQNTAEAYGKDLRTFVTFMKQRNAAARWSTITRADIDAYIIYQAGRGLTPATTNRHLASISSMYRYMKRQGMEVDDPARYESRRKNVQHVVNTIPMEELQEAVKKADGSIKVMLQTLINTGVRIQECLDITKGDLDVMNNIIKIKGKGMKERLVHTTHENMSDLVRLCGGCGSMVKVFAGWTQRDARRAIYTVLSAVSNAPQKSPHAIRHTFATLQAAQGTNSVTLAKMMGHNSIKTTQKYIDMAEQQTAAAFSQYQSIWSNN